MNEIAQFFGEVSSRKTNSLDLNRVAFVAISEWGWTQQEFEETEIPFLFAMLEERGRYLKEQKKAMKKKR